jgi:hypothetical protein
MAVEATPPAGESPLPTPSRQEETPAPTDECEEATLISRDWVTVFTRGDTQIYVRKGWIGATVISGEIWINGEYQYEEAVPFTIADGLETFFRNEYVYRPGADGRLQVELEVVPNIRYCGWQREAVRPFQIGLD